MNNPNYPASGFPTQPQTSTTPAFPGSTPLQQGGDMQQLGSTQSNFVNQFVNDSQQTTPQDDSAWPTNNTTSTSSSSAWPANNPVSSASGPAWPANDQALPTNDPANVNPPMQSTLHNDPTAVVPSAPALNTFTSAQPSSLPKLEDNDDFALPSLNNNATSLQSDPTEVDVRNTPTTVPSDTNPIIDNMAGSANFSPQSATSFNTIPVDNVSSTPADGNLSNQGIYNPSSATLTNDQFQVPQTNLQANPVTTTAPSSNNDPQEIGTHQITVNEDYADFYNRQQAAMQMNILNKQIEPMSIDFSRPATTLNVDQDFSDGGLPASDDTGISTGFLPSFDDTSDDGILPVVTDDDEPEDADPEDITSGNAFVPYGFSDFDPNEQDAGPMVDHLSSFESQSLEDTADKIDVDYSEQMPQIGSTQQSVGVLNQEPAVAIQPPVSAPVQTLNYMNQTPQVSNQTATIQQVGGQNFVPLNTTNDQVPMTTTSVPTVEPAVGELSPAARLNQLLEAEEAAEKVVMQKQDQMLDKTPESQQSRQSKVNVFKQLDPDASLDSDLKSQMSVKKPSSKYFLLFSVVIIISIIGFLLVLLGLMLL